MTGRHCPRRRSVIRSYNTNDPAIGIWSGTGTLERIVWVPTLSKRLRLSECWLRHRVSCVRGKTMATDATVVVRDPGREPFELPVLAFSGAPSTLCKGCGHNSITSALIEACKQVGLNPYRTVKVSGIGCSSKTPAYFLQYSHGFNSLHGRMPSVSTGAVLANSRLVVIGVSGDGDTANIGLGQFKHACRRNVPMLYLVEDNGCYGLTKGQFSATADLHQHLRRPQGEENDLVPFDLCQEAITAGATYAARLFAGDRKQLIPLLKGGASSPRYGVSGHY